MRSMLYRLNFSMSGGPLYCTDESSTMRSKLYRLNLSMSGGALYCIEGSQYGEVHAVQVELVHVWRDLVLHRGVLVQRGPSCTG